MLQSVMFGFLTRDCAGTGLQTRRRCLQTYKDLMHHIHMEISDRNNRITGKCLLRSESEGDGMRPGAAQWPAIRKGKSLFKALVLVSLVRPWSNNKLYIQSVVVSQEWITVDHKGCPKVLILSEPKVQIIISFIAFLLTIKYSAMPLKEGGEAKGSA